MSFAPTPSSVAAVEPVTIDPDLKWLKEWAEHRDVGFKLLVSSYEKRKFESEPQCMLQIVIVSKRFRFSMLHNFPHFACPLTRFQHQVNCLITLIWAKVAIWPWSGLVRNALC